jgi:hypothetical protein
VPTNTIILLIRIVEIDPLLPLPLITLKTVSNIRKKVKKMKPKELIKKVRFDISALEFSIVINDKNKIEYDKDPIQLYAVFFT